MYFGMVLNGLQMGDHLGGSTHLDRKLLLELRRLVVGLRQRGIGGKEQVQLDPNLKAGASKSGPVVAQAELGAKFVEGGANVVDGTPVRTEEPQAPEGVEN